MGWLKMSGCFSDIKGGQQAIGGADPRPFRIGAVGAGQNEGADFFFRARGSYALFTQIESDPIAIVYARKRDGTLDELGRTEIIMNTLNPVWIEKVPITYQFEIVQPLVFHVFDVDTKYHNLPIKDPLLRISRVVESGGSVPICKTKVVKNNLNPNWKPLCLPMQQFGSKDNSLVIECFDFNSSGKHKLIGKLQKSIADLEKLHNEKIGANFHLPSSVNHGHEKVLKGQLFVDEFREKMPYSFLDYISSGFELNFMVSVDFTASNKNPRFPDSLHYIDPSSRLNAYQQAILEVGEVIQFYDSDKRFPAWGFGGRLSDGAVSHCFNLNGNARECEVEGVNGIMSAYASVQLNVSLAGPTLFGQVINKAAQIASQSLSYNQSKYYVLLIITDGVLTDLQETKEALVRASDLPSLILIVGVGGADFKEMEIFDADNGQRLESLTGRIATCDIVQFVPMREVYGGQISLVQALLEELPGQFLMYMRSRDIKPHFINEAQGSVSEQSTASFGGH